VLFRDLHPASSVSPQLNIRVYKSNEAFQSATRTTGPEAANGLFVPDKNTIETYFPGDLACASRIPAEGFAIAGFAADLVGVATVFFAADRG
jgi:hypothetical protein